MKVDAVFPGLRWFAIAMLVAIAGAVSAPKTAEARCGDYVVIAGQPSQHLHMGEHAAQLQQAADSQTPASSDCPCNGPMCSRDDSNPTAPPPVPSETSSRQWGVITALPAGQIAAPRFATIEDRALAQNWAGSSLFRPPRVFS